MPELPDITVYVEALKRYVVGREVTAFHLKSPFVVRSVFPDPFDVEGRKVVDVRRSGKQIILGVERDLFVVVHLMIAGRLHWRKAGSKPRGKNDLAAFAFEHGTLLLTEAAKKKRASIHTAVGEDKLATFDRGGLEVLDCTESEFADRLRQENHTLKRSLSDPHLFSGIGNAYSDEILHAARLSPLQWTSRLSDDEVSRLFKTTHSELRRWIDLLREQTGDAFPEKVTAFRPEMAVHGRYQKPCPDCGHPVQRIVYAESETNYCAACQTGGRVLADRSLSRLLKDDWPRTLE